MKKIITYFLSICLTLNLSACNISPDPTGGFTTGAETSTTAQQTDAQATSPTSGTAFPSAPMVSVCVPVVTESEKANDGTVIFEYAYQDMALTIPDPDVADKVILDFLNHVDATRAQADTILSMARSAYTGNSSWTPYMYLITYAPTRIDYGVLSMFGSDVSYAGTAHPDTTYISLNYDLVTGDLLTLDNILTGDDVLQTLCRYTIDALEKIKNEKRIDDGFEAYIESLFSSKSQLEDVWYFSQNGLCIYIPPYEIAPYASGVITAEIPYERLAGIVNDAYFPAEQDIAIGTISAQPFSSADLDNFKQFSEIILENDGEQILLHTDASVKNIRIETGSWSASGSHFTPKYTVFAASGISSEDAIMVQAKLSETTPSLRLSYTTASVSSGTVTVYIAKGETDQSVKLIPG